MEGYTTMVIDNQRVCGHVKHKKYRKRNRLSSIPVEAYIKARYIWTIKTNNESFHIKLLLKSSQLLNIIRKSSHKACIHCFHEWRDRQYILQATSTHEERTFSCGMFQYKPRWLGFFSITYSLHFKIVKVALILCAVGNILQLLLTVGITNRHQKCSSNQKEVSLDPSSLGQYKASKTNFPFSNFNREVYRFLNSIWFIFLSSYF